MSTKNSNKKNKSKDKNENKNKSNILNIVMFCIYMLNIITVVTYILSINIMPDKYIAIIVSVFALLALAIGVLLFKVKNKIINVLVYIIIFITLGLSAFGYNYSNKTLEALESVSKEAIQKEDYYIISSKIKSKDELNNKYLYILDNDEMYKDVIKKIDEIAKVNYDKLDSLEKLTNKVIELNNSAILISASQYDLLCESNEKFKEVANIIYTVEHEIGSVSTNVKVKDEYTIENGKFHIFISGIDTRGSINTVGRSDANILLTIDTTSEKTKVHMTSIPRDYYVKLGTIGQIDKLTHSGIYGVEETIATVEKILDVKINYYARVGFSTVTDLVDAVGGIELYSDKAFTTWGNTSFNKGINYVNGEKALIFARERYAYTDGDNQRIRNQQQVIEAIINKALSSTKLVTNYSKVLAAVSNSFQTNITTDQITYLVKNQIADFKGVEITKYSLKGTVKSAPTYSMGSTMLSVMVPDGTSAIEAKEKIEEILE